MLVNENISYLISEWLIRPDRQLRDFPWYLTTMESQHDFFRANVKAVTISILRHQPTALADFSVTMGENMETLVKVNGDIHTIPQTILL